ncbi:MAG: amidohydrolase family protein [Acidobacteria bacterium]|nr:amidohydrolase [Acidobacteriota bacterium]MCZ6489076.1 amidohydrolase family protein [Acidobacteriota bacterium]
MILDIFPHIFPRPFYEAMLKTERAAYMQRRVSAIPVLLDLELRFRIMDQFPGYQQVLTMASPPLEAAGTPETSPELARIANDGLAELTSKHPDRFPTFAASLPMNNMDACLKEVDRVVQQLGARGVQIFSNVNGRPLDDPEFRPLFERMAAHDLPIWLHPIRGSSFPDYQTEKKSLHEMWFIFGWPYETTLAMSRMVMAGMFDEFPNLKVIAHHTGGMVPFFEGRLGPGLDTLGSRTPKDEQDLVKTNIKGRPLDHFRKFYADTASFGAVGQIVCGMGFFGVDHMLFASDMPFDPEKGPGFIRDTIRAIEAMAIAPADRAKIYEENARRVLKLPKASS